MLPLIGITMGEPKGIGPEVLVKALLIEEVYQLCLPVVVGPKKIFKQACDRFGLDREMATIELLDLQNQSFGPERLLHIDINSNVAEESTLQAVKVCAEMCMGGVLDAMVTGPVDKHRLNRALGEGKVMFRGHTEFLAKLTRAERVAMMLAGERLRVVPVTTHCALSEVPELISLKNIVDAIELTAFALKEYFDVGEPRIGVAALNPHAGEKGLLGEEEEKIILPAVEKCRLNGIEVSGPFPADTLFHQAVMQGRFDAVVTMYHDQALIPLKLLHFHDAVNITLGLPIVRTSVDHGTAYDLVGKNRANPSSMIEAIRFATHLSRRQGQASDKGQSRM